MKRALIAGTIWLAAAVLFGQASPKVSSVEPDTGKAGAILTLNGENLAKPNVEKLFLTDGTNDFEMQVVEHTNTAIKFKISDKVKAGRYAIMIQTGGPAPKLVEEPVKVTVE
jgi:hypothetical protein